MRNRDNEKLKELLEEVEAREVKKKRRILFFLTLPICLAIILLFYFAYAINNSSVQVTRLNKQIESKNAQLTVYANQVNRYKISIDSINAVYESLNFNYDKDFGWSPNDIIRKNPEKIKLSRHAHEQVEALIHSGRINTSTLIRYYSKVSDKDKIEKVLLKCGFRNINVYTDSYRNGVPTNTITYSPDISKETLQVIAFSLIRAGLQIRIIEPFSERIENQKRNSIEISGTRVNKKTKSYSIEELKKL